jgi:RNA polymerase sigma factor (sigma-70 family)
MSDSPIYDPADNDSVVPVINRLRRFAISRSNCDVEGSKDLLQEMAYRLYKAEPWNGEECLRSENVIAYGTTIVKNIQTESYNKEKVREGLKLQAERAAGFGKVDNEGEYLVATESRMFRESLVKALLDVPAFVGNEKAQTFIQYEFVDDLTHEEIAEKMGFTTRQLTKWKPKFYKAIPQTLIDRFFGKRPRKK